MHEHSITFGEKQLQVEHQDEQLHVVLTGTRPQVHRLSRQHLWLTLFLSCACLTALYVCWEVTMPTARKPDPSAVSGLAMQSVRLEQEVRVVCFVLTTPKYHKTRAVHVLRTWGKRCNKIYFMTSEPDDELETIVLSKPDKYEVLWGKTKEAFTYLYEHKLHEGDWFMKADDDTYVFVENLRYLLYAYPPTMPIYFGFNFKLFTEKKRDAVYMSGGSGYVLSREALRLFVHGLNDSGKCRERDDNAEDLEAGACLYHVGVPAGDSRDAQQRYRFYPMAPYAQLISGYNGKDMWFTKYAFYNPRPCLHCLSDYPIAFHYINPDDLYLFDYLNYEFDLYGRQQNMEHLPDKIIPKEHEIPLSDNWD